MIILDFGSGATSRNDITIVKRMIDELVKVDSRKHEVVIKWQLFKEAPPNIPLHWRAFDFAYWYAKEKGYQTTSSVNDKHSLKKLLTYDIPFVKIANRPDLYWLAGEVPRKVPVYASVGNRGDVVGYVGDDADDSITRLCCVSEYPATLKQYEDEFNTMLCTGRLYSQLRWAVSDHTTDFQLYHKYEPLFYEVHYKLEDSTGPDAGSFARTAAMLAEIL